MEYEMHARAQAVNNPFASPFAMQYVAQQRQQQQQQHQQAQQQSFQVQQPHMQGSPFIHSFNTARPALQQQHSQTEGLANNASLAVQQPYAAWGSGALLNLATTRRPKPQPLATPKNGSRLSSEDVKLPSQEVAPSQNGDEVAAKSQVVNHVQNAWPQKVSQGEEHSYQPTLADLTGSMASAHEVQMMNFRQQLGAMEQEHQINQKAFQREDDSRRPSQISDSTYATTRLTTPDMMHPSDSEWSSAERPLSMQRSNMSPMDSPATAALRPGSRARASPVPHNNVRASPYTLESNRRLRWSTGMTVPSQAPPRFPPYQQNNRYSSYFGFSPLNPHNGLTSVSNEQGITTFAAPGQSLAYNQRMSMGPHFMMHQQAYTEQQHNLPPQAMFAMLPSEGMHGYNGNFADMSDPPDLFASLHEKPSEPPEEDMNPSDPDMVPHEQELRFAGDLYTPRWVRGHGNKREGWCGLCKPGRWLVLKNSAYWYDKSFTHGVCAQTGAAFAAPEATRRVEGNVDAWEGLCGHCGEWLSLVSSKKKGPTTWFRHVSKCHVLHKPKDMPKRRRNTNRRSTLTLSGSEIDESSSGEVQPSGEHFLDMETTKCDDDHAHDHDHGHDHEHGGHDHQAAHAQFIFDNTSSTEDSMKPLLSPAMVSPRTTSANAAISSSMAADTKDAAQPATSNFLQQASAPANNQQSVEPEVKIEAAAALDTSESSQPGFEMSVDQITNTTLLRPPFVIDNSKCTTPMQAVHAPPSPALTPVSTPQLSESSMSTPQMDAPSHSSMPVVGLGVHILTGIPENDTHDFDFGDLSRLEELYGNHANSEGLLDHGFGETQNTSVVSEVASDKMDTSYSSNHSDEIPAPTASMSDSICMSSQFDMMASYPEHPEDDMQGKHPFSDEMLQMHMGMQIALSGDNGDVSALTSDSYWTSMEQ